ncbi:MAG: sulfatase-like hydrolase/transferase [Chthoniobacterales bacterium]
MTAKSILATLVALTASAVAADWPDRTALPIPLSPFEGKIGKTYQESEPGWQQPVTAPEGAPNVIVILLDDVGFGQTSTFGGLIPTPNLTKLASEGLKYNRFHTTAICGPSRAALLTGRNHHDTGNGFLMEWATGFPNYSTQLAEDTATIGEILKENGYATWWFGKNHNTPDWETTVAGPFDRWPTGMGFNYFYGFNAGETHQFYPVLFENTVPVESDKSPEAGYHFMTDMTDRAIARMQFSKSVAPNKPLAELKAKFAEAAASYDVYPLDDRGSARLAIAKPPVPGADADSTTFTYHAGATRIAEPAGPPMKNRSWTLTADLETNGADTNGVIMGFGGVAAGIVLYVKDGIPVFDYNYFEDHTVLLLRTRSWWFESEKTRESVRNLA